MNPANSNQHVNSNFFVALLASGLALFLLFTVVLGFYEVATGSPSDGFGFELMFYWPAWLIVWFALAAYYSQSNQARTITRKAILLALAINMIIATTNHLIF